MTSPVRKAVIPAAGLGTRFLPATKSQPKEMLPVVDKPSIQYVVEEAVRAGLTDILIITGRGKRAIEDHFDRNFELEYYLEQKGKDDLLKEVQETSGARQHPLHPPEGPARSRSRGVHRPGARGRRAVRGPARRRHHGRRLAAAPLDARRARPLRPVRPRAQGGHARPDLVVRLRRARSGRSGPRARAVDRREAEEGRRAVEPRGHRSLRVHARDLRRAGPHRAGRRRRAAAHRRDRAAQRDPDRLRPARSPTAATTSVRRSTSCGRTSSSRSTARTSVPSSSSSSSSSCGRHLSWRPRSHRAPFQGGTVGR